MDTIDRDVRAYVFRLVGEAGRAVCCSVSSRWNKYAMSASLGGCPQPHLYNAETRGDPADFNDDELAAMFSDFHLLCRIKPTFAINTRTACAGGSIQAAALLMARNGTITMTDAGIVVDPRDV